MYTGDDLFNQDKRTLSEVVTDTLRYNILAGRMVSGEKIKESFLAKELEVSRAVIREAFIRLETEGLIEKKSNHSAYIKRFDYQDTEELFEYRRILEIAAAERILNRGIDISEELEKKLRLMKIQVYNPDDKYIDRIRLDMSFHRFMVNKCGNVHIIRSWETLYGQLLVVLYAISRLKYTAIHDLDADMQASHMPLVEAFRSGDIQRVRDVLIEHIGFGYHREEVAFSSAFDGGCLQ